MVSLVSLAFLIYHLKDQDSSLSTLQTLLSKNYSQLIILNLLNLLRTQLLALLGRILEVKMHKKKLSYEYILTTELMTLLFISNHSKFRNTNLFINIYMYYQCHELSYFNSNLYQNLIEKKLSQQKLPPFTSLLAYVTFGVWLVHFLYSNFDFENEAFQICLILYIQSQKYSIMSVLLYLPSDLELLGYSFKQASYFTNILILVLEFLEIIVKNYFYLVKFHINYEIIMTLYYKSFYIFSEIKNLKLYQEFKKSKKITYHQHESQTCNICFDSITEAVVLQCGHDFHKACLEQLVKFSSSKKCPYCGSEIKFWVDDYKQKHV